MNARRRIDTLDYSEETELVVPLVRRRSSVAPSTVTDQRRLARLMLALREEETEVSRVPRLNYTMLQQLCELERPARTVTRQATPWTKHAIFFTVFALLMASAAHPVARKVVVARGEAALKVTVAAANQVGAAW